MKTGPRNPRPSLALALAESCERWPRVIAATLLSEPSAVRIEGAGRRGSEMAFALTDYVEQALTEAVYDKLEDGSYAGHIPSCHGVVAFGASLRECENELHSTLEDWILLGLRLGHKLPVIAGIDLNREPTREPVDAL